MLRSARSSMRGDIARRGGKRLMWNFDRVQQLLGDLTHQLVLRLILDAGLPAPGDDQQASRI